MHRVLCTFLVRNGFQESREKIEKDHFKSTRRFSLSLFFFISTKDCRSFSVMLKKENRQDGDDRTVCLIGEGSTCAEGKRTSRRTLLEESESVRCLEKKTQTLLRLIPLASDGIKANRRVLPRSRLSLGLFLSERHRQIENSKRD